MRVEHTVKTAGLIHVAADGVLVLLRSHS
jgi:hypothetical protein